MLEFGKHESLMRIQEMKSGFLHLKKTVENDRLDDFFEIAAEQDALDQRESEPILPPTPACELDEPRWSVVSFDQLEAGGLNYRQAAKLMNELNFHGISGLCIVTDEAASRIRG